MKVKRIDCANFRNYEYLSLELNEATNILFGDNAQGKTNALEAIYLGGTTKSHKGIHDKEIIKIGCEEAHIRIFVEKNDIEHKIDMHLHTNKTKGIAVDGIPVRKSSDMFGLLRVVLFSPEDLGMIKNGPAVRRRFIDLELSQLNLSYLAAYNRYNNVLKQRNNLLKQIKMQPELKDTIDVWDTQLCEYGIKIMNERQQFIDECNKIAGKIHYDISGGKENLEIVYQKNVDESIFAEKLKRTLNEDIILKSTGCGPHRDDLAFYINGEDVKKFGSQGQQRTVALALKLAELELMREKTGENPVLLLDDVLSELDRNRQSFLLDRIQNIQTIITCTGLEEFVLEKQKKHSIFKVVSGTINKM